MKTYHIIWTDETGIVNSAYKEFSDFESCEEWLKSIHALYWEIGIDDSDCLKQYNRNMFPGYNMP